MIPKTNIEHDTGLVSDTMGGVEEPPTSDLDDNAALSTVTSVVSADEEDGTEAAHLNRKRKISIDLSDETNIIRKPFQRTHTRSDKRERLESVGGSRQEDCTGVDANSTAGLVKGCYKPGTSRSAEASRKLRKEVDSGTYIVNSKKLESWKTKIRRIDPDVDFHKTNTRKVQHTRCAQWIVGKEPGDTTRFKEHLKTCTSKPVPVGGMLIGMGWLKKVDKDGERKGRVERKPSMPCHGVTELDNALVDQYLNQTGAGGGGARSIQLISKERFGMEYRNLTKGQKDEVDTVQRGEWAWRNDHLNRWVHATNCDGFTSSHSLTTSLCLKCKSLLDLKAFTVAIRKKTPLDENMKYVNARFVSPALLHLYGKIHGLRYIMEQPVSNIHCHYPHLIYNGLSERKIHSLYKICGSCIEWEGHK